MIKQWARELLPLSLQVPGKYLINTFRNQLEKELELLKWVIKSGDRVIDVGGNRGIYSYKLWKLGCRVEIFEPNPVCLNVLSAWSMNKPMVSIHAVALSNKVGVADLHIPIDGHGIEHDASASLNKLDFFSKRDERVELRSLDSYLFENISFIKIDVEGHELNVLHGARNLLKEQKPSLLIEIEQRHCQHSITDVFNFLNKLGFNGFYLDNKKLKSLVTFNLARDQRFEDFNEPQRRYINNFLFLHQDQINQKRFVGLFKEFHL